MDKDGGGDGDYEYEMSEVTCPAARTAENPWDSAPKAQ